MKNTISTKYKILKGKKKRNNIKPRITKLASCRTALDKTHVTYIFFT